MTSIEIGEDKIVVAEERHVTAGVGWELFPEYLLAAARREHQNRVLDSAYVQ